MREINQANLIVSKSERLFLLRVQDEILPFTEKPSDTHTLPEEEVNADNTRVKPFELFSLFTADIIKKKVVYTR
jgi:hypothetical protein